MLVPGSSLLTQSGAMLGRLGMGMLRVWGDHRAYSHLADDTAAVGVTHSKPESEGQETAVESRALFC
jgi:hypothetical protein